MKSGLQTKLRAIAGLAGLVICAVIQPMPGSAKTTQLIDNKWNICRDETRAAERSHVVPSHLLTAISMAESGRWNGEQRANLAWPWTVTARGEGHFYPTKAAAIAAVRNLKAEGLSNIDVGCMQINLKYHPNAFKNLEQAFTPKANVAYAASLVKTHFATHKSWIKAASAYHSTTPKLNRKYKVKLVRLWRQARKDAARKSALVERASPSQRKGAVLALPKFAAATGKVDRNRMMNLNKRTKSHQNAQRNIGPENRRRQQLASWRNNRNMGLMAKVRRIEADIMRKQQRLGLLKINKKAAFAARRNEQLAKWRLRRIRRPNPS